MHQFRFQALPQFQLQVQRQSRHPRHRRHRRIHRYRRSH
jgi:hypothetical protein